MRSFDWDEYQQLARVLADPGVILRASDTARQRAAVSRSYYAAFCLARSYLRTRNGQSYSGPDAHQQVRTDFNRRPERAAQDIARMLRTVQVERNHADYDDDYNVSANLVTVFNRVEQILTLLKTLP